MLHCLIGLAPAINGQKARRQVCRAGQVKGEPWTGAAGQAIFWGRKSA